jgi:hypothetical protein
MKKCILPFIGCFIIVFVSLSTGICQTVTNGSFDGTENGWTNCGLTGPEMDYAENAYGGTSSTEYVAEIDNGDSKGICQTISGFTSGASAASSSNLYINYGRRIQGVAPSTVELQVCLTDPGNSANQTCTNITSSNSTWGAYSTLNWNFTTPTITSGTSLILSIKSVASPYYDQGGSYCPEDPDPQPSNYLCGNNYGMIISYVGFTPSTPVTLVDFKAVKNGTEVDINWQTATEINNDYFTIEKSKNAVDFTAVGIVDGAGNSQSILNYQTTDPSPYNGVSYYRLKQTDLDGTASYSKIVAVNLNADEKISIHPNPGTGIFRIQGLGKESEITVHNPLGQTILIKRTFSDSSEIDLSSQSSGVYYIKVNNGDTSTGSKIILNR